MFAPRAPDLMPIRDTTAKREPTPNARSISRDPHDPQARPIRHVGVLRQARCHRIHV
jgi:hypothetical protein